LLEQDVARPLRVVLVSNVKNDQLDVRSELRTSYRIRVAYEEGEDFLPEHLNDHRATGQ
jgi:hypothetical protein